MDYATALARLEFSEIADKLSIVSAITARVDKVLEEKRAARAETETARTALESIAQSVGAEGADFESRLKASVAAYKKLQNELEEQKAAFEAEAKTRGELEAQLSAQLRANSLAQLASQLSLSPTQAKALAKVVGDAEVVVSDDSAQVGGKGLEEWLKSEDVAPFLPALGRNGDGTSQPTPPKIPTSIPGGRPGPAKTSPSAYELVAVGP
jgi:chromosome segregation ATPase